MNSKSTKKSKKKCPALKIAVLLGVTAAVFAVSREVKRIKRKKAEQAAADEALADAAVKEALREQSESDDEPSIG